MTIKEFSEKNSSALFYTSIILAVLLVVSIIVGIVATSGRQMKNFDESRRDNSGFTRDRDCSNKDECCEMKQQKQTDMKSGVEAKMPISVPEQGTSTQR